VGKVTQVFPPHVFVQQVAPKQVPPAQVAPLQVLNPHVTPPAQVGCTIVAPSNCSPQASPSQVTAQVLPTQVSPAHVAAPHVRLLHVKPSHVGPEQVGAPQVGPLQVSVSTVGHWASRALLSLEVALSASSRGGSPVYNFNRLSYTWSWKSGDMVASCSATRGTADASKARTASAHTFVRFFIGLFLTDGISIGFIRKPCSRAIRSA
jgi:hypothetical protein